MSTETLELETEVTETRLMDTPWANLGTSVGEDGKHLNSEQAIQKGKLDWQVSQEKLFLDDGTEVEDLFANVRSDTRKTLGITTEKYRVVQNVQAFDFVDSLLQDGIMKYENVLTLKGGKRVVLLARMPTEDSVVQGDVSYRYVLLSTSHDGSSGISILPTSIRVYCQNSLNLALRESMTTYSIRHSASVVEKLEKAKSFISQFDRQFTKFNDQSKLLAGKKYTQTELKAFVDNLFPPVTDTKAKRAKTMRDNKVELIQQALKDSRQTDFGLGGTWYSAFNAITQVIDHSSTFKGKDEKTRNENKFVSVLEGPGALVKEKAFNLALSMV